MSKITNDVTALVNIQAIVDGLLAICKKYKLPKEEVFEVMKITQIEHAIKNRD